MSIADPSNSKRRRHMGLLARAPAARLAELLAELMPELPPFHWLRAPEVGAVMMRGRIGAAGAPFNLAEITVTRCVLRLGDGTVGHATVQGRDKGHATRAAVLDALLQGPEGAQIAARVLAPLDAEEQARRQLRAEKAAATKVEFFTMVRGED